METFPVAPSAHGIYHYVQETQLSDLLGDLFGICPVHSPLRRIPLYDIAMFRLHIVERPDEVVEPAITNDTRDDTECVCSWPIRGRHVEHAFR